MISGAEPVSPLELFSRMACIRQLEEALLRLFSEGRLYGTTHTSLGQEAIAVAVGASLSDTDIVFSSHRCHGHYVALGGPLEPFLAELMGREAGLCGGRGGSQHLHYAGRFFSSGVQGGIVGNAVGAALGLRLADSDRIVTVFLGDGTLGEGLVYESLNFAALRHLPVLFVVENNRYAQSTPVEVALSGSMTARAEAFGIAAHEIETNDVLELRRVFQERAAFVRERREPFFQVVHTYRLGPHSKGDDHRNKAEIDAWRDKEPLRVATKYLSASEIESCLDEARTRVAAAIEAAEQSPKAHALPGTAPEKTGYAIPFAPLEMTYVESLRGALGRLLEGDPSVFLMGEDMVDPYGGAFAVTRGLSTRFPDRVISTPISEAGIVAWGTGAALMGARPIVEIMFGDFLSLAADQLLNHAAKYGFVTGGEASVPLVVRTPMGGGRGYGPTHSQSIEKLFLGVPGLTVVAPSHLLDAGVLLERAAQEAKGPVLFIEHKKLYPATLARVDEGRIGPFFVRGNSDRFPTLHLSLAQFDAPDLAIICYGGMAPLAMEVAEALMMRHELAADLIVPSQLAPLPVEAILGFVGGTPWVATIEEGTRTAGWGAEVVAALAERSPGMPRTFQRFAAADSPIPAAGTLEAKVLPDAESIIEALRRSAP